jgi:hypothetical protein
MELEFNLGKEEGLEQGRGQINALNQILLDLVRFDDLKRATTDKEFQEKLIKELVH